jgi:hypothetical protein
MEQLPAQMLPAGPFIRFGIFDLTIANILAWSSVFAFVLGAAWLRLPRIFEPQS